MDVLLDTNILARCVEPVHPHHRTANEAVELLVKRGDRLCVVPQVLYEYFVVCTRPQQQNGGLGMSNASAVAELDKVTSLFNLIPDTPSLYSQWRQLIEKHAIIGKSAHDARIAAALLANGIPTILTFNARDFRRYGGFAVIDPVGLLTP